MVTTEYVSADEIRPGNRLVVCFGIVTVRGIKMENDRVTWYWLENQPEVSHHRGLDVQRVIA